MSDLYRHYKNGLYRRLFDAILVPKGCASGTGLMNVLHSDDKRELRLIVTDASSCRSFETDFAIIDDMPRSDLHDRPHYKMHVVYVSLRYGTVWARPKDEFEGDVVTATHGYTEPRFAPILTAPSSSGATVDTFAENERLGFEDAIGRAEKACKAVEHRHEMILADAVLDRSQKARFMGGYVAAGECRAAIAALIDARSKDDSK